MKYQSTKPNRVGHYFWKATVSGYWFNRDLNQWEPNSTVQWGRYGYSSHSPSIKSIMAFRRRLKEWRSQLPKGTEVCLINKYVGLNVIAVIK